MIQQTPFPRRKPLPQESKVLEEEAEHHEIKLMDNDDDDDNDVE